MCSHIYFSVDDRLVMKTTWHKYHVKGTVVITPDAIALSTALAKHTVAMTTGNEHQDNQFSVRNAYTDRVQNYSDPGRWFCW